jgi:hypothetical protein
VRFQVPTAANMKTVLWDSSFWWWRRQVPLKCRNISTRLHGAKSQGTAVLIYVFVGGISTSQRTIIFTHTCYKIVFISHSCFVCPLLTSLGSKKAICNSMQ